MADLDRKERLQQVGAVLMEATPDPSIDALVAEAAAAAGTPIALVSIVGRQAQVFRGQHGLPEELAASCGTSRSNSFCQFVVAREAVFEVIDAANDVRVPKELVEAYGIRAYLGVPVRLHGEVVGSLCTIDVAPRTFAPDVAPRLSALATQVSARLEQLAAASSASRTGVPIARPVDRAAALETMRSGLAVLRATLDAIDPITVVLAHLPPDQITPEALLTHAPLGAQGIELHGEILELATQLDIVSGQLLPSDRERILDDLARMALALAEMGTAVRALRAVQSNRVAPENGVRALRVARETFASVKELRDALARLETCIAELRAPSDHRSGDSRGTGA